VCVCVCVCVCIHIYTHTHTHTYTHTHTHTFFTYIHIHTYIGRGQRSRAAHRSEIPELPTSDGEWRFGPDTGQGRWPGAFVQRWVKANPKLTVFLCCLAFCILFAGLAVRKHGPLGQRGPLGSPGGDGNPKSNGPGDTTAKP